MQDFQQSAFLTCMLSAPGKHVTSPCEYKPSLTPEPTQVVQVLLDARADANFACEALDSKTALHSACENGHEAVAALLIPHMTADALEYQTRSSGCTAVSRGGGWGGEGTQGEASPHLWFESISLSFLCDAPVTPSQAAPAVLQCCAPDTAPPWVEGEQDEMRLLNDARMARGQMDILRRSEMHGMARRLIPLAQHPPDA